MGAYESKLRYEKHGSVDRYFLATYVCKKLDGLVELSDVISVISIMFEEIVKDLVAGKKVKIDNFGILVRKELKAKRHFNRIKKEWDMCKASKIFRFFINKKMRNIIFNNLDIEKTLDDDYHG